MKKAIFRSNGKALKVELEESTLLTRVHYNGILVGTWNSRINDFYPTNLIGGREFHDQVGPIFQITNK